MFSQKNNGFSADLLKAVREATTKGPAPRNLQEVEEAMKKAEGTMPKTPREKKLAAMSGNPGLITKGDVVKARMASEEAEPVQELSKAYLKMKKYAKKATKEEFEPVEEGMEDKLDAARARHNRIARRIGKPEATGAKKTGMKSNMRKVAGTAYGGSKQPDDMKEELFTDAELEAISTAAAKL